MNWMRSLRGAVGMGPFTFLSAASAPGTLRIVERAR